MTAVAVPPPTMVTHTHPARQVWVLARRSILAAVRQPVLVVPTVIFPLFFAALGSSSFSRATRLPGFPEVDSFLDFTLAATIVQGVLFGSILGATEMAKDIEDGFIERLLASPVSRTSIIVGRLAGAAALGAGQALLFTLVLLPFGVEVKAGVVGVLLLMLSGGLTALAVGGFMSGMAIKTGSQEAVQGSFPLLFILLFFSSAFFPRETMSGLYKQIADLNPVSYLVEGARALVIDGISAQAIAQAILIPLGFAVVGVSVALWALRRRLAAR